MTVYLFTTKNSQKYPPGSVPINRWHWLINSRFSDVTALLKQQDQLMRKMQYSNTYNITKEVAVGERIACWIRTPQVPGSRPGWYGTFYWASDCWPQWQHQVERSLVCVEGLGRISRSGLTQDIKMGSCVFQCDVPHQWIAQRQVGPVSVYCDRLGCRVLCLRHGISVWQHIGQSTTATIWPQMFQSDVKPKQTNKQTILQSHYLN